MSKKSTANVPATANSLSEAIRQGLAAIPDSARARDLATSLALKKWIGEKFPQHKAKLNTATYYSTLSTLRKEASGEVAEREDNPTFSDMTTALALCENELEMTADELIVFLEKLKSFRSVTHLKNSLQCAVKMQRRG
jgi:hypothetical protein